ncbi:hypothetical protein L218DRAFT_1027996, partial [Marasmius fiardii PR-910]
HDSQARFPQPRCSEDTQEQVLSEVLEWAHSSLSPKVPGICWLWGSAGVGKSAIAQTIAERCDGKKLLATFFFSRSDPNRNNPRYLALAIAHGILTAIPHLHDPIVEIVYNRPEIFHVSLDVQFRMLVTEP